MKQILPNRIGGLAYLIFKFINDSIIEYILKRVKYLNVGGMHNLNLDLMHMIEFIKTYLPDVESKILFHYDNK